MFMDTPPKTVTIRCQIVLYTPVIKKNIKITPQIITILLFAINNTSKGVRRI